LQNPRTKLRPEDVYASPHIAEVNKATMENVIVFMEEYQK
jgi:hypothetical protein